MIRSPYFRILATARQKKLECERLEERIRELERQRTECSGIRYSGERVQGTNSKDQMLEGLIHLDKFYEQLYRVYREYKRACRDAELIICVLPDRLGDVLRLRYIEGAHWKDIERETGYSFRHCMRLHEEALNALERKNSYIWR